jgi:hypothetical protein
VVTTLAGHERRAWDPSPEEQHQPSAAPSSARAGNGGTRIPRWAGNSTALAVTFRDGTTQRPELDDHPAVRRSARINGCQVYRVRLTPDRARELRANSNDFSEPGDGSAIRDGALGFAQGD